jgi:hypothetical protein
MCRKVTENLWKSSAIFSIALTASHWNSPILSSAFPNFSAPSTEIPLCQAPCITVTFCYNSCGLPDPLWWSLKIPNMFPLPCQALAENVWVSWRVSRSLRVSVTFWNSLARSRWSVKLPPNFRVFWRVIGNFCCFLLASVVALEQFWTSRRGDRRERSEVAEKQQYCTETVGNGWQGGQKQLIRDSGRRLGGGLRILSKRIADPFLKFPNTISEKFSVKFLCFSKIIAEIDSEPSWNFPLHLKSNFKFHRKMNENFFANKKALQFTPVRKL